MTYSFNRNQIDILNRLVFDADIECDVFQNLIVEDSSIKFNIERLEFENVQRSRFLLWTSTRLDSKMSLLEFKNVKDFQIEKCKYPDTCDCSILQIKSDDTAQIKLVTTIGPTLVVNFQNDISILLTDIGESDRQSGSLFGTKGFTKEEWNTYLKQHKYTT